MIIRNLAIGIIAGVIVSMAIVMSQDTSQVIAQMGGDMSGHDMRSSGDHGSSGGHGMSGHAMSGMVHEMCHGPGDMPPHYCEPTYHTMSSVKGIKISKVELLDDDSVVVTVRQIGKEAGVMNNDIVLVGGSGHLAGATVIENGWQKSKVIEMSFDGMGTLYDHQKLKLHLFPLTG